MDLVDPSGASSSDYMCKYQLRFLYVFKFSVRRLCSSNVSVISDESHLLLGHFEDSGEQTPNAACTEERIQPV